MYKILLFVLWAVLTGCQFGQETEDRSESADDSGTADYTGTVSSSPGTGSDDESESPAPQDGDTDQTLTVDVGNPKDTGPKPKPNFRLYVADAPSDSLVGFMLEIAEIRFLNDAGQVLSVPQQESGPFNLLNYQNGAARLLFEGLLPPGRYLNVQLLLAGLPQAQIEGMAGSVDTLLQQGGMPPLLRGDLDIEIPAIPAGTETGDETVREFVWHIPLWRDLRLVDGDYALTDTYELQDRAQIGALQLTGLELLDFRSICVSRGSADDLPLLPSQTMIGNYDCPEAGGRVVPGAGTQIIPFLDATTYVVDVYITETLYLRLPQLVSVEPLITSVLGL